MSHFTRPLALLALASFLATTSSTAHAVVNVQNLIPTSSFQYMGIENAAPEVPEEVRKDPNNPDYQQFFLGLNYTWVDDPLVRTNFERTARIGTIIDGVHTLDFLGGLEFNGQWSLNADIPLHFVKFEGGSNEMGLGDIRVFPKYYFDGRENKPLHFMIMPEIWLPTGSQTLFVTDDGIGLGAMLGMEWDFGGTKLTGGVGYRMASNAQYSEIDYRNRVPLQIGLRIPITEKLATDLEATGNLVLPFNRYQNPGEVYAGLTYMINPELVAMGGLGLGAFNAVGSSDFRFAAALKYRPWKGKEEPAPPVPPQPPRAPAPPARVVYTKTEIQLNEEVLFENDRDVLLPSARQLLDEVAQVIKQHRQEIGNRKIWIEGHTNEIGSDAHNMRLSEGRAKSVKRYLKSRGIAETMMVARWYGERRPKYTPNSPEGRGMSRATRLEANRRVEFKIFDPSHQDPQPR